MRREDNVKLLLIIPVRYAEDNISADSHDSSAIPTIRHNKLYSRTISVLNMKYYRSKSLSGIGQRSTVGSTVRYRYPSSIMYVGTRYYSENLSCGHQPASACQPQGGRAADGREEVCIMK